MSTEAAPQRALVGNSYSNIIKGGPDAYRTIAPQVDFAKQQFAKVRRTLRDTVPGGGAFTGANRQLAGAEAGTISNLYRDNIMNAIQGLSGFSQGTTNQALAATGGVSNVSQQLAQLSAQRSQGITGALGGIAGALGTFFGLRGGGGGRSTVPLNPANVWYPGG